MKKLASLIFILACTSAHAIGNDKYQTVQIDTLGQVKQLWFTLATDTDVFVTVVLNPPLKAPDILHKFDYRISSVTLEGWWRERPALMPGWPARLDEKETEMLVSNEAPESLWEYGAFSSFMSIPKLQALLKADALTVEVHTGGSMRDWLKIAINADDRERIAELLKHALALKPKPTQSPKSKPGAKPSLRPQKKLPRTLPV
jgi:hypothetical protein